MKIRKTKKSLRRALASLPNLRRKGHSLDFLETFTRALDQAAILKSWQDGERAIAESMAACESGLFSADEVFVLIHDSAAFYASAGKHGEVIDLFINASNGFADVRAFQSAYRVLNDADEYATIHEQVGGLLKVREAIAIIALIEGDLPYARKAFANLMRVSNQLGMPIPDTITVNLSALQLRNKDFRKAAGRLRRLISANPQPNIKLGALINYSICARELGQLEEARSCLYAARSLTQLISDNELLIELELVEAKTAAALGDYQLLLDCLLNAVRRVDSQLLSVARLHYRRGIRERYRQRISSLLCALPTKGRADQILDIVAFLKSNSLSDWMAVLDWRERMLANNAIPVVLHARLLSVISKLADSGVPALYGFHEKYDEPWSRPWRSTAADRLYGPPRELASWSELTDLIREIGAVADDPGPWPYTTCEVRAHNILFQLHQSDAFLVVLFADGAIQLFVLVGDFYGRYPFVEKEFIELQEILANFQTGGESRQDYMEKLAGCVNRLGESLKEELDSFLTSELARIVILPEQFELPLLGCIMAHPGLRRRAKDGKLAVNVCPVLHPHFSTTSDLSSLTTCFFKGDNLKLLGEEMQLVKGILPSTSVRTVELSPEVDLFSVLASSIVHFAAHGVPISNFSDAFFSTSHPAKFGLSVSSLQTVAWTTPHQIVFLNACFTADTLNWNVFQGFKTNEQIGLPSTLLLNRRAVVIASSWTTFDVAGYLVAAKFYGNLRHDAEPDIAFAKALAELVEMTSEELVDLLSGIQDERLRTEKQRLFADGAQPFRHPYVNGTYQFISLL